MTPERWQRIKSLYEEAAELPAAARHAWLARLEVEDAALRGEVEAMLAAEQDSRFLDEPALAQTERAAETERRAALIGQRLGHYQVLSAIGAGGMGEIYLARDLQLERQVALKVLPAQFTADAERVRRFAQEARATSALNHPNILTVHDIGHHEGAPYIVAELLEGAELRALLPPLAGALPVSVALDYARQIAAGLSAAHEKGIVHRDLKPENLFVINDGRVKILDFGLAKLKPPKFAGAVEARHPAERLTGAGVIMGTVGYMSPEQVRGEEVDQRSDLFSFGAILYEMLAGQQAFHCESMAETMAAILKEEPSGLAELSASHQEISPQVSSQKFGAE